MAQAWIQLLSLLSLLLSAQGFPQMPYGDPQEVRYWGERAGSLRSQEFESNTTTIQDILKELPGGLQVSAQGICRNSLAYGGSGGVAFAENRGCDVVKVTGVKIRAGTLIDSIQLTYSTAPHGLQHGGNGGDNNYITLHPNEVITAVFGRSGSLPLLDAIGFATNQGRIYGPYGGTGGAPFTINQCEVQGVFGRAGLHVDSIGFYCAPYPRAMARR